MCGKYTVDVFASSGNSKAKLYAAIISGIMVIILTTWVVVLLLMFDKEAVAHRIGKYFESDSHPDVEHLKHDLFHDTTLFVET